MEYVTNNASSSVSEPRHTRKLNTANRSQAEVRMQSYKTKGKAEVHLEGGGGSPGAASSRLMSWSVQLHERDSHARSWLASGERLESIAAAPLTERKRDGDDSNFKCTPAPRKSKSEKARLCPREPRRAARASAGVGSQFQKPGKSGCHRRCTRRMLHRWFS